MCHGHPARRDHGQDAHATARDDRVLLVLLSATLRPCVFALSRLSLLSLPPKRTHTHQSLDIWLFVRY